MGRGPKRTPQGCAHSHPVVDALIARAAATRPGGAAPPPGPGRAETHFTPRKE